MNLKKISFLFFIILSVFNGLAQKGDPPVKAPFEKLDTYCTNDWWNHARKIADNPKKIIDVDVPRDEVICFGIYTVHNKVLKMSA